MASLTTMEKLHLFHKLERDMFHRLVHDLAEDPASMRWVIAFWLWLESAGHRNFIRRVASMPGPVVLRFVEEAIACLRCLAGLGQSATAGAGDRSLPCTGALMTQPIDDVGYFEGRGEIMDGVSAQYRSVCLVVCDVGSSSTGLPSNTTGSVPSALLMPMVSSPIHAAPMVEPMALMNPMAPSFTLNPMAAPWIPPPVQSPTIPEDYRSLFVTFSRGYPISKEDILEFFNS